MVPLKSNSFAFHAFAKSFDTFFAVVQMCLAYWQLQNPDLP
jgi:hypothetical protein